MKELKIIIIDDDVEFANTLREIFEEVKIDVFETSESGINAIKDGDYDVLLLDYFVDSQNGEQIISKVREFNNSIYTLLLTGYSEEIPALKALDNMDIQDYCQKDALNFNEILVRIKSAMKSVNQIEKLKDSVGDTFAWKLKMLRELNGEMQSELADVIGVSRQTICGYECGRSEPSFDILKRICKHYKVSIDFMLSFKF